MLIAGSVSAEISLSLSDFDLLLIRFLQTLPAVYSSDMQIYSVWVTCIQHHVFLFPPGDLSHAVVSNDLPGSRIIFNGRV